MLIDESLPRPLAGELAQQHDVSTVRDQQWLGLRNGALLRAAAGAGFDVFLTADRSLPYQQNLRAIGISVLVLTGVRNPIDDHRFLTSQLLSLIRLFTPRDAYEF